MCKSEIVYLEKKKEINKEKSKQRQKTEKTGTYIHYTMENTGQSLFTAEHLAQQIVTARNIALYTRTRTNRAVEAK
jgi:hypothetical protein